MKTFNKWQSSPVIVTFDEKSTPVWKIPFPAITICPETKYKKQYFEVDNLLDNELLSKSESLSKDHFDKLNTLYQVCNHYPYPSFGLKEEVFSNCSDIFNNITIDFEDSFQTCVWSGSKINCENLFHKILTDEGVCWTFNMLDHLELFHEQLDKSLMYPIHDNESEHWTLQGGYTSYAAKVYPHRVLGSGITAGLNLELRVRESDIDYACKGPVQGFKIALHTSGEMPQFNHVFYQVPLKQQVLIAVKPEVITTSPGLNAYLPKKRQCYFNGEKKLKFFKVYTQSNCELECLTEYTLKQCGCVKFSQPHNSSTNVCNFHYSDCYRKAKQNFIEDKLEQKLNEESKKNIIEEENKPLNNTNNYFSNFTPPQAFHRIPSKYGRVREKRKKKESLFEKKPTISFTDVDDGMEDECKCLPACTSIEYNAEISQSQYEYSEFYKKIKRANYSSEYVYQRN